METRWPPLPQGEVSKPEDADTFPYFFISMALPPSIIFPSIIII